MHLEHLLTCTIDKNILLKCKGKDALKVFDIITLINKINAEKAINITVQKYCSANFKFKGKDALKVSSLAQRWILQLKHSQVVEQNGTQQKFWGMIFILSRRYFTAKSCESFFYAFWQQLFHQKFKQSSVLCNNMTIRWIC